MDFFMKCPNVHFSLCRAKVTGMPRIEISLSSIWSSVLAYVWYRMLFSSIRIYLQHIARPVESDCPRKFGLKLKWISCFKRYLPYVSFVSPLGPIRRQYELWGVHSLTVVKDKSEYFSSSAVWHNKQRQVYACMDTYIQSLTLGVSGNSRNQYCWRKWDKPKYNKWTAARQNQQNDLCAQRRLISAWAFAHSDQSLLCAQCVAAHNEHFDQTGRMSRLIWATLGEQVILMVLSCAGWNEFDQYVKRRFSPI